MTCWPEGGPGLEPGTDMFDIAGTVELGTICPGTGTWNRLQEGTVYILLGLSSATGHRPSPCVYIPSASSYQTCAKASEDLLGCPSCTAHLPSVSCPVSRFRKQRAAARTSTQHEITPWSRSWSTSVVWRALAKETSGIRGLAPFCERSPWNQRRSASTCIKSCE